MAVDLNDEVVVGDRPCHLEDGDRDGNADDPAERHRPVDHMQQKLCDQPAARRR